MGNENQIDIDRLEQSKSAFLPQEFQDPDAVTTIYSLEEEYAKTRKNKSVILYILVFLFLTAVIAGSIVYTGWLQNEGKNITIDISDFEDVRLLELVNDSKSLENDIDQLQYEIREAEIQHKEQMDRLDDEYRSQRDAALSREISDEEKQSELAAVRSRYNRQVAAEKNQYETKMASLQERLRELEAKLAKLKEQIGAKGKIARTALGNKDELHNLQLKKLQNYYEDKIEKMNSDHQREINSLIYKFNPSFSEAYLRELIRQRVRSYTLPDTLLENTEDVLTLEDAATMEDVSMVRKNTADQIQLLDRLQKIPYQNSVPRTLLHAESLSKSSIQKYDEIVVTLAEKIRKKNLRISQYDYALSAKLRIDGESGFVLDTRNRNRIPVYIDPTYRPQNGTTVFVFRNSEEIATATIRKEGDFYYIQPTSSETAANIEPLDYIMLRVTQE